MIISNDSKRILTIAKSQTSVKAIAELKRRTRLSVKMVHVKVDEVNIENCRRKLRKIAWLEQSIITRCGVAE
jgi:hypothetical protein